MSSKRAASSWKCFSFLFPPDASRPHFFPQVFPLHMPAEQQEAAIEAGEAAEEVAAFVAERKASINLVPGQNLLKVRPQLSSPHHVALLLCLPLGMFPFHLCAEGSSIPGWECTLQHRGQAFRQPRFQNFRKGERAASNRTG
jgi:hypothetical protein